MAAPSWSGARRTIKFDLGHSDEHNTIAHDWPTSRADAHTEDKHILSMDF